MEKKKNTNHGGLDIAFKQFEFTVKDSFILPEKILFKRMKDAYYNLSNGRPQEKDKYMDYSNNSNEKISKDNLTDKGKASNKLTKEPLKRVDFTENTTSDINLNLLFYSFFNIFIKTITILSNRQRVLIK